MPSRVATPRPKEERSEAEDLLWLSKPLEELGGTITPPATFPPPVRDELSVLRVAYFFAGPERKGDIRSWLQQNCDRDSKTLQLVEIDLLRGGDSHDLSRESSQEYWLGRLQEFSIIIVTPPCSSFSRVQWANDYGPHPIRSAAFPSGFPWLSSVDAEKAALHNSLISFTIKVLQEVDRQQLHRPVMGMFEHPEDLGRVQMLHAFGSPSATPASVWRFPEIGRLIQNEWWCGAFLQCAYGAPTAKPTRCLSNSKRFLDIAPNSLPIFDQAGYYTGPTQKCEHKHKVSLVRKAGQTGVFRTQAAAAYPPLLCKAFADSLYFGIQDFKATPSDGETNLVVLNDLDRDTLGPSALTRDQTPGVQTPVEPSTPPRRVKMRTGEESTPWNVLLVPRSKVGEGSTVLLVPRSKVVEESTQQPTAAGKPKWELQEGVDYVRGGWWGKGEPIRTHKSPGKPGRPFQDGGGLCCPGRWVPSHRNLPPKAIMLTSLMDQWLDEKAGSLGEKFFEDICFKVLSGKCVEDPFTGQLGDLKHRVSELLANEGLSRPEGAWRKGQEIDFGFLFMLGAWFKDPDHKAMAEFCKGVRVGVGVELPRTPTVWPSKKKWPLGEFGEDPVSDLNSNYPSAREHREALVAELADQEDRGWALPMTLRQAQERFGEVCVAPLAVILEKPTILEE